MVALLLLHACTGAPSDARADTRDTGAVPDTGDTADTDTAETADTDTDTAGTTPPDQDGDGHGDLAQGGDDCDDGNAYIYPGAPEYCDTVDQDCDREPLGEGMCGEVIPVGATGTLLVEPGRGSQVGLVGDLTGDGYADLVRDFDEALRIYAGGPANEAPFDESFNGVWHAVAYTVVPPSGVHDAGDMNGDGWDDLVYLDYDYGARVRYGPFEGDGTFSRVEDDGVAWLDGYFSSSPALTGADIDGDGRTDLATTESDWDHASDEAYKVFFGVEPRTECPLLDTKFEGVATPIGDGDGDGITETAWMGDGGTWILAGADVRSACGGYLEDYAVGKLVAGSAGGTPVPRVSLGDWDGDGVEEWMADRSAAGDEGLESIWIFAADASVSGDFTTDDAAGSWVYPADNMQWGPSDAVDLDADGLDELMVYDEGLWVIRGGTHLSVAAEMPERVVRVQGDICSGSPCGRDFDGDGYGDMIALLTDYEADTTSVRLLPGFDIPWDDDTRW